jgi:nucleoside-diphosphate kinase
MLEFLGHPASIQAGRSFLYYKKNHTAIQGATVAQLLVFLKPDAVLRTNIGATILKELAQNDSLKILSFEERRVDADLSAEHYAHVADRPFYPWLERYVTTSPVYVMLAEVEDEGAVEELREFLGKTISHLAEEGSIRGRFGIYAGVNCVHMSDSLTSGQRETALWKERLEIRVGRFDTSIEDFIDRYDDRLPDHTMKLREICLRIADEGSASVEQIDRVRALLSEECRGASAVEIDLLTETVVGSCLN